jgi:hypothetical protein
MKHLPHCCLRKSGWYISAHPIAKVVLGLHLRTPLAIPFLIHISGTVIERGSKKTVSVSVKDTPCFWRLHQLLCAELISALRCGFYHVVNSRVASTATPCYKDSMSVQLESTQVAILDRVIKPGSGDWPRAAAEAILGIGFDRDDRERMNSLLEKAKEGDLSDQEAEALENYRHIGKLLELMKSRARRSMQISAS